jgi:hypothetical protein
MTCWWPYDTPAAFEKERVVRVLITGRLPLSAMNGVSCAAAGAHTSAITHETTIRFIYACPGSMMLSTAALENAAFERNGEPELCNVKT